MQDKFSVQSLFQLVTVIRNSSWVVTRTRDGGKHLLTLSLKWARRERDCLWFKRFSSRYFNSFSLTSLSYLSYLNLNPLVDICPLSEYLDSNLYIECIPPGWLRPFILTPGFKPSSKLAPFDLLLIYIWSYCFRYFFKATTLSMILLRFQGQLHRQVLSRARI